LVAERAARSESLRLAYVALTRARHKTVVCWGVFRQRTSPLGHLLHPPAADDARSAGQKLYALDDARILADLDRLTAESGGTIRVNEVDTDAGIPFADRDAPKRPLAAKILGRRLERSWRSSSFSALAASEAAVSVPAAEGRDVDEEADGPLPSLERGPVEEPVTLHAFPRGARAGDLVHHVLEHLDFSADPAAIGASVRTSFERYGFDLSLEETLSRAISEVLATPLGSGGARLRDLTADRRLSELEFVFPVAAGGGLLRPETLAAVIDRHRIDAIDPAYPARVARLGFEPLTGFLRGFIDLVFEHDGRVFVADYKSNHLGPKASDYRPERLAEAMAHHHYHLQYLIYCVAVHRYLGLRSADYDYDRDFGGVFYLFLRGMHPRTGASRGVFAARPSRALIESLGTVLDGGSP
jgi:exodeoxyribonuclease V beta subunit